jgi:hypothetical protein
MSQTYLRANEIYDSKKIRDRRKIGCTFLLLPMPSSQARSIIRPNIDVDIVGPVVAVVAEYVPAEIVSLKPGLMPSFPFVPEVSDIGRAEAAAFAAAYLPFERPVIPGTAYLGPERKPLPAKYPGHSVQLSRTHLNIILIAFVYRWTGIYRLIASSHISGRCSVHRSK